MKLDKVWKGRLQRPQDYATSSRDFNFHFCILVCIELFQVVESLSTAIQKPTASVQRILEAAVLVKTGLIARSDDASAYEEIWAEMEKQVHEDNLFPPKQPRKGCGPCGNLFYM